MNNRTCIICRKKTSPIDLMHLNFRCNSVELSVFKRDHSGRGYWICSDVNCLGKFITKTDRYSGGKFVDSLNTDLFIENSVSALKRRIEEFKKSGNTDICRINGFEKRLSIFQTVCEGRRMP